MEGNIVQILVHGGMTSVTLASLYVLYKINGNHIAHSEKANERFAVAIEKLADAVNSLRDKL